MNSNEVRQETELTQIAAVAAATIQDLRHGSTQGMPTPEQGGLYMDWSDETEFICREIAGERYAQEEKWGAQHHHPAVWLAILVEEVAEFAAEIDRDGIPSDLVRFVNEVALLEGRARRLCTKYDKEPTA